MSDCDGDCYDVGYSDGGEEPRDRIAKAMTLIEKYGQIDGAHHKAWVLDQIARVLKDYDYENWVKDMLGQCIEGAYEYEYDEGIAP